MMKVDIYSREAVEELLKNDFPDNVAVISFYDPINRKTGKKDTPVDYSYKAFRVFSVAIHDIDLEILSDYGLTYDTYFPEVKALAEFIYDAYSDGLDIICQCVYGQSRSAACAAAILEHFYHNGISVFSDYRYYPNQMIFHKVLGALEQFTSGETIISGKDRKPLSSSSKHNEETITSRIMDMLVLTDDYYFKYPDSNYSLAGIIAYVDLTTEELRICQTPLFLDDKVKNYCMSDNIEAKCIYHLKAYYAEIDNDHFHISNFIVTEIIEKNVPNAALEHLLEKYTTPFKTMDDVVGNITFSRCHWGFCGTFHYWGQQTKLTIRERDIWTEEIEETFLDKLHILLNYLEDMKKHIPDNINNIMSLYSIAISNDFQNNITIVFHMPLNQQVKITFEVWISDDEPVDLHFSKQEFFEFLDAWNLLTNNVIATMTDTNQVGIWWYTDKGELWEESIPTNNGILCGTYIQYSDTENHLTLWPSIVKKYVKGEKLQRDIIAEGYKSIERGRVIYNTATMTYEITCSQRIIYDSGFRKKIVDYYHLSKGRYEFTPLNHYHKIKLTGNPALDEFIESN